MTVIATWSPTSLLFVGYLAGAAMVYAIQWAARVANGGRCIRCDP